MKALWRVLTISVIVAALSGGGFWLYQRYLTPTAVASTEGFSQVVAVQRGDLSASISVVGELAAVRQEDLSFDHAQDTTQLLSLQVEAGHAVEEGQVLATIDAAPYQQALDQASSDLQESEEELADLLTPPTELEIAQADLAITRARLNLEQATQDLEDMLDPDVADLESNVAAAELDLSQAQADLRDLEDEEDETTADRLYELREEEAERSAEYTRLANESYSDAYYEDRLRVAYNDLLEIQETIGRTETQAEITLLNGQLRVEQAEDRVVQAQEALAEGLEGPDDLTLAEARLRIAHAEVSLAEAKEARADLDEETDPVRLASLEADVKKKQLALADAEEALEGATLRAPFAGTVLETAAEWGDLVNRNSVILTLADLTELRVLAQVDETTIRQVAEGQTAAITFDAFPGQTLSGEVISVPMQGTLQGGVMVYEVTVYMPAAEGMDLKVGMTANVEIEVGQVSDALLVPTMALVDSGGLAQVLVTASSEPEPEPVAVPVEIGLSDGVYTQIVRGLNEGDQVVVQLAANDEDADVFGAMRGMMGAAGPPPGEGPRSK
jgi:multidrug efflux pump subunit AcrA (membrane-fusion protein)